MSTEGTSAASAQPGEAAGSTTTPNSERVSEPHVASTAPPATSVNTQQSQNASSPHGRHGTEHGRPTDEPRAAGDGARHTQAEAEASKVASSTNSRADTTPQPQRPAAGVLQSFGNYDFCEVIGSGSFSTVYRAVHRPTQHTVAIKAVARKKLNPKLQQSLESEISILRDHQHPNIVALSEIAHGPNHIYLVLEFCNGGDLHGLIRDRKRICEENTRELMTQLACGLHCLWFFKLIHRDLKPHNLLLTSTSDVDLQTQFDKKQLNCTLKIADFGFARHLASASMAETLCGSPLYMAPEILQLQKYDAKADLWSVGTILYEMLCGVAPFTGTSQMDLLRNIQTKELRIPPGISVGVHCVKLLQGLLQRKAQQRMEFPEFVKSPFLLQDKLIPQLQMYEKQYRADQSAGSSKDPSSQTLPRDSDSAAHAAVPARPPHLTSVGTFQTIPELFENGETDSQSPHSGSPHAETSPEGSSDDFVLVSPGPKAQKGRSQSGDRRRHPNRNAHSHQPTHAMNPQRESTARAVPAPHSIRDAIDMGHQGVAIMKLVSLQDRRTVGSGGIGAPYHRPVFETLTAGPSPDGRREHESVVSLALLGRSLQLLHEAIGALQSTSAMNTNPEIRSLLNYFSEQKEKARHAAQAATTNCRELLFGPSPDVMQVNVDAAVFQGTVRLLHSNASQEAIYDDRVHSPETDAILHDKYETGDLLLSYLWKSPQLRPEARQALTELSEMVQTRLRRSEESSWRHRR